MDLESKNIKCSKHEQIDAVIFCQECNIYMCNKCQKPHSELFDNHNIFKLDKDIKNIFTGFCKESNHKNELIYFCKNHNILCCSYCISKVKDDFNGRHKDCNICSIKEIEKEKKNKLKENLINLNNISKTFENSINVLKNLFEKMNENKEKLKIDIQNIFTKIRQTLNEREDELLKEVDKKFDDTQFKEETIKKSEKLPKKIKESLEKGNLIINKWSDYKLNSVINDCLIIENNFKDINNIYNIIKNGEDSFNKINFKPDENDICNFLNTLKNFGNFYEENIKIDLPSEKDLIYEIKKGSNASTPKKSLHDQLRKIEAKKFCNNYTFNFPLKKCSFFISEEKKFIILGEGENIITKTGTNFNWTGTISNNKIDFSKKEEYIFKFKILNTEFYNIMLGVATMDFNFNKASFEDNKANKIFGWYYSLSNGYLFSREPQNYSYKNIGLDSRVKELNIIIKTDIKKKYANLKFIINDEDKGDSYTKIPLDKPISPSILLFHTNDSVEILEMMII